MADVDAEARMFLLISNTRSNDATGEKPQKYLKATPIHLPRNQSIRSGASDKRKKGSTANQTTVGASGQGSTGASDPHGERAFPALLPGTPSPSWALQSPSTF